MIIRAALLTILCNVNLLSAQMLLSHNDYEQDIPLHDAISRGFDIIEADVFLRDSTIVVCHDKDNIGKAPTLNELYISPLNNYNAEHLKGKILMLDIKEYSTDLLSKINDILITNKKLFSHMSIMISGDFDRQVISADKESKDLILDGRHEYLDSNINIDKMPIISIKITEIVNWNGCRNIKRKEALKLKSMIDEVHYTGRKIRFWNVDDAPQAWNVLRALGVDIIGVDNLEQYSIYKAKYH